jgi:NAD(P)H dehydrogenase (quinone)
MKGDTMKIGVTGATGHLGRLVVRELAGKTAIGNIVALVRSPGKAADLGVEAREFDYGKPESLKKSLMGIEKLLLISSSDIGQRARHHANVIEAAKGAGVKWIVYTSLLHADSSSLNLAGEHRATEAALKASRVPYTILRNGWYTENHTGSLQGILAGGAVLGSAGNGKFSSAARADLAAAAAVVLVGEGHQGKSYELAGDDAYTLADFAAEISRQTGKNIPYKNVPEGEYAVMLKGFGLPEGIAGAIASWDTGAAKGDLFENGRQLSKLIGRPTTAMSVVVAGALAALK